MIRGSCHCGAVRFELRDHRDWLTKCNCSACRRYCALWLHADQAQVALTCGPESTLRYQWGDRKLAFHTCRTCGCTTHWMSTDPDQPDAMAVNCRLAEPANIASIPIRHFDGANSWRYLD